MGRVPNFAGEEVGTGEGLDGLSGLWDKAGGREKLADLSPAPVDKSRWEMEFRVGL